MKRNKKATRRARHAARLHAILEECIPDGPRTCAPADRRSEDAWGSYVYTLRATVAGILKIRVTAGHAGVYTGRVFRMATEGVEALPIVISLVIRGRGHVNLHAEFAENYNRVKHGDVL
jgi:hypothetical protein